MICHHYKTIFIHLPKNAGQSIEHVFLNLLNLTWETRAPLLLRPNNTPEIGPPVLAHLKAHEYVLHKYVTQEQFDAYFKFAFVRNPWDRMISIYKYLGFSKKYEFNNFLKGVFLKEQWVDNYWFVGPQSEFIYDNNGELKVDFVGRFENLQKDFNQICTQIGISIIKIPYVNKSDQKKVEPRTTLVKLIKDRFKHKRKSIPTFKSYQEYNDEESKEIIAELYKTDIELFGYQFNGNAKI